MIKIKELIKEDLAEYWKDHWEYLNRDIFPFETLCTKSDEEDIEYFRSDDYRGLLEKYMDREPDKAHFIYFYKNDIKIGCAQYIIYKSEDAKCFLLDFWILPEYRRNNIGHECFQLLKEYVKSDEAKYFQINISNENNYRFWRSLGFEDDGLDEWDNPLMRSDIN